MARGVELLDHKTVGMIEDNERVILENVVGVGVDGDFSVKFKTDDGVRFEELSLFFLLLVSGRENAWINERNRCILLFLRRRRHQEIN